MQLAGPRCYGPQRSTSLQAMPLIQRFVALAATALVSLSGAQAESLSKEAMFARLSALAPNGNAEVKYNLGMFLNNGIGTAQDNVAAFRYFTEAAEAGHPLAAYKVGCYLAGQFPGVVPVNEADALKFKLRAAEAGYMLAQSDVGLHYGKQRDMDNALLWWERASRQGSLQATVYLAHWLSRDKSPMKAKGYALSLQARDLSPKATNELLTHIAKLEAELTPSEKAEAQAIHASWLTGKSPLTVQADTGMAAAVALLAAGEQR